MLTNEQQLAILSKISTGRILALAADLEALDRLIGGQELDRACERLAAQMRKAGTAGVELQSYAYGPEHRYFGWTRERRPYTEEAELWLLSPEGGESLICRSSDNPACSMDAFRSTSDDGDVFEVVDVGFGTRASDYRSQRMPGKVALASGHNVQAVMLEALAQRQAEGLLCGPGNEVADPGHVVPNKLSDPSLFHPLRPFGFNLSGHQFNHLLNLLASGATVQVRVRVRVTMDTGVLPVISGFIEGSELRDQRVVLLADLSHHDAPLGVACLQEILRTLGGLVVDGQLSPPRRTLQVLLAPSLHGLVAWLSENRDHLDRVRALLHLSVPSCEAATRIEIHPPLPTRPSFIVDLLHDHLRWARDVRGSYRGDIPMTIQQGSSAPPSSMALPQLDVDGGLATASISCTGRPTDPSTVSHGPLHRLTAAVACAALDLCNIKDDELPRLLCSSHIRGLCRLVQRAEQLHDQIERQMHRQEPSSTDGRHLLWLAETSLSEGLRREQQILDSCRQYLDHPGQLTLGLADSSAQLEQAATALGHTLSTKVRGVLGPRAKLESRRRRLSALERRASAVVVHRQLAGPLPIPCLLREAKPEDRSWLSRNLGTLASQPVGELLMQWVDGKRTLLEIYERICVDFPAADLKLLWRYLEVLEGAGFVDLKEMVPVSSPPS